METHALIGTLLSCIASSLIGNEFAHRRKRIERTRYGKIALGVLTGFVALLFALILQGLANLEGFAMYGATVALSLIYSYFMADAKAFEGVR
jgi:hypothetical protein